MIDFNLKLTDLFLGLATRTQFVLIRHDPLGFATQAEVDILVDDFRCGRFLRALYAEAGDEWEISLTRFHPTSIDVLLVFQPSPKHFIRLDVRGPVLKRGGIFLRMGDIVGETSTNDKGLPVVSTKREVELIRQRNQIDGRPFSPKHERILAGLGGKGLRDTQGINQLRHPVRAHFIRYLGWPVRAYSVLVLARYRSLGKTIALHGVDGAGKSTVASTLGTTLSGLGYRTEVLHYFERTAENPPSKRGLTKGKKGFTGALIYPLKLFWFIARGLLKNLRMANQVDYIIHDRFFFDYFDKTEKKGFSWPSGLKFLVAILEKNFFIPIVLTVSPSVAHTRKEEMSLDQIVEKQKDYVFFLGAERIINGDGKSPQELADAIARDWLGL